MVKEGDIGDDDDDTADVFINVGDVGNLFNVIKGLFTIWLYDVGNNCDDI